MDIGRIRQLAKEQGVDLEIQGLVCLPREIKKYTGYIQRCQRKGGVSHVAIIRYKDFYLSKTFKTEAKAEQYIRLTNVREGLPIRKSFTVFAYLPNFGRRPRKYCTGEKIYYLCLTTVLARSTGRHPYNALTSSLCF